METNYTLWALGNLMSVMPLVICDSGKYEDIDWCEIAEEHRPSENEVLAEIERIKTTVEPKHEYRKNRAMEYPPIGDQLDALYRAGMFPPEMAEQIAAVKAAYPKPDIASGTITP
jgi:hypothetical protein